MSFYNTLILLFKSFFFFFVRPALAYTLVDRLMKCLKRNDCDSEADVDDIVLYITK